jgi:NAD(P)H-hydrate epimerase
MPGAAILVVRAAHRAGGGRVTLGFLDRELATIVPVASPETVMVELSGARGGLAGLPESPPAPAFLARVLGPGLGATERTRELVRACLEDGFEGPQVFDADALNVLDGEPEQLRAASGPVVITPHAGEAGRLLGRTPGGDPRARSEAARELAERSGAICVLKGAGTVVTDGSRVHVNATGNPGMATAGAGDVLTGILGAYLAATRGRGQAFSVFDAAASAVHVHGLAGDLGAAELGERALVASDLVAFLPAAQRAFE